MIILTLISIAVFRLKIDFFAFFAQKNQISAIQDTSINLEINSLREQIAFITWKNLLLEEQIKSLTEFREKFSLEKIQYIIPATIIIKRDSSDKRCSFVVDRGKSDGVEVGNPVISGISLVGRVFEVMEHKIGRASCRERV